MQTRIEGVAYVLGDNIDTDQIIPAQYLTYNPSIPAEYKMFGKYALIGVPDDAAGLPKGHVPFHTPGGDEFVSPYTIIIGGKNFGCGSSREHAPIALAAAGVVAVVAEFYARIFYRNSVNGGYLVPLETKERLIDRVCTGDKLVIDIDSGHADQHDQRRHVRRSCRWARSPRSSKPAGCSATRRRWGC